MKKEYFPGASTPDGFFTYLPTLLPNTATGFRFDIKGSSGSGKSTLLKKTAAALREKQIDVEYLHCASDPTSLDGLILPQYEIAVTDSTAPHAMDPALPGISGCVVDLYACLDSKQLARFRPVLSESLMKKQALYQKAFSFLSAASALLPADHSETGEAEALAETLVQRFFPKKNSGNYKERRFFLFAVTPDGIVSFADWLPKQKIILRGSGASQVIDALLVKCKARGIACETGYSPLSPKDHPLQLILPAQKIALVAECPWLDIKGEEILLSAPAPKWSADVHHLLDRSITAMRKAREWHKKIEGLYAPAMDFSAVDDIGETLLQRIFAMCDLP